MTTGPVRRLKEHLLDGAGLQLKIGIAVKASGRGRQVCREGGCRQEHSVYAAIGEEGTISVVIVPASSHPKFLMAPGKPFAVDKDFPSHSKR